MSLTVNLIGAGKVGQTLLRLLAHCDGYTVGQVASASMSSAQKAVRMAGCGQAVGSLGDMDPADIWFLTVPDMQIADVASGLATIAGPDMRPAVAIHCSGFHTAAIMSPLRENGWHLASAHPVLSFADAEVAAERFPGTYCGVEGDAEALIAVRTLLTRLGAQPFAISSDSKILYHAAAVFSNNFTTVLQAIAREAWQAAGVSDSVAQALNASLLRATVENIEHLGPRASLTGPAARGDLETVELQLRSVVEWHAQAGRLYAELSDMAARLKASGSTSGADHFPDDPK